MRKFKFAQTEDIYITKNYIYTSVWAAKRNWFIENCTINKKFDMVTKDISLVDIRFDKHNMVHEYTSIGRIQQIEEFFAAEYENISRYGLVVENHVFMESDNGKISALCNDYIDLPASSIKYNTYGNAYCFYNDNEKVCLIAGTAINSIKEKIKELLDKLNNN